MKYIVAHGELGTHPLYNVGPRIHLTPPRGKQYYVLCWYRTSNSQRVAFTNWAFADCALKEEILALHIVHGTASLYLTMDYSIGDAT